MNVKWDKRFLEIAKGISSWSKDPSRKIGALIVGENRQIISQGYNGFARGINDDFEILQNRIEKYKYIIHAELNAILNALYNGASVKNATIYVTGLPVCNECAKAIIQSGIKRVVIDTPLEGRWAQSALISLKMFEQTNVEINLINDELLQKLIEQNTVALLSSGFLNYNNSKFSINEIEGRSYDNLDLINLQISWSYNKNILFNTLYRR